MASQPNTKPAKPGQDVGQGEIADKVNEANAQGFYGTVPDETPNHAYTLEGVNAGEETPETRRVGNRDEQPHADTFNDRTPVKAAGEGDAGEGDAGEGAHTHSGGE